MTAADGASADGRAAGFEFATLADAVDASRFGGKAAGLARLIGLGLPVPPGFALTTAAAEAVAAGGANATPIVARAAALGPSLAVRSSALDEDGHVVSFAGQHLSLVGVKPAALVAAVGKVHASGRTESARDYRRRLGLVPFAGMGVVVQRALAPRCAGVLFTRDPLTGADEIVVEAAWGLGEAVVSGLVVPDRLRFTPSGVLVEELVADKDVALVVGDDGAPREHAVPAADARRPCLPDDARAALLELAARCTRALGPALDLEWAVDGDGVWLLQCRPITRCR
jgi:pyruvate,water dikinase